MLPLLHTNNMYNSPDDDIAIGYWIKTQSASDTFASIVSLLVGMSGCKDDGLSFSYIQILANVGAIRLGNDLSSNNVAIVHSQIFAEGSVIAPFLQTLTAPGAQILRLVVRITHLPPGQALVLRHGSYGVDRIGLRHISDHDNLSINEWDKVYESRSMGDLHKNLSGAFNVVSNIADISPFRNATFAPQEIIIDKLIQRFSESSSTLHSTANECARLITKASLEAQETNRIALQTEREELQEEYKVKTTKLIQEREELDKQRKIINDKRATIERRDVRDKLLSQLEDRLQKGATYSRGTEAKGKTITWSCWLILLVSLVGFTYFAISLAKDTTFIPGHVMPMVTCAAIFISTFVFYLRWRNGIFQRLAVTELRTHALRQDVMRASWFAELLFEYKDENGKSAILPPEIVQAMTRNLFADIGEPELANHPVDDIMRIMRRMKSVDISNDGFKISR